jgi:hypothetical protein
MPVTEASKFGPLIFTGAYQTPLVYSLGVNFNPDGSVAGLRDVEILSAPAFTVANIPDLGSAEDLGTSTAETLVWDPQITPQTPQSQCIHFLKHDISASQLSQSIQPGAIIPYDQMVSGNRYLDATKINQMDSYTLEEIKALAALVQRMEWVVFNSELQIPSTDLDKWKAQGIINGCTNVIDAAGATLTSAMLTNLSLLVPPMAQPVLFIPGAFFSQIKSYTTPAANIGPLSEPLVYVALSTQPVRVMISPKMDPNSIVLMDIAKCRLSFLQTRYTDESGSQQFNDVIFSIKESSKKTGAEEGRVGTYFTINPGSFSYHAVIKNVLPAT